MSGIRRAVRLAVYLYVVRWLPEGPMPFGKPARCLRRWVCTPLFANAGSGINVERGAFFGDGSRVSVGDRSSIGINARLHGTVAIGRDVMMGPYVLVYALGHATDRVDVPMIEQGNATEQPVTIDDDVWLGARSILLPGVRVGRGSVVGAGAVVARSVPPYSVVVGNPARVVRSREGYAGDQNA